MVKLWTAMLWLAWEQLKSKQLINCLLKAQAAIEWLAFAYAKW